MYTCILLVADGKNYNYCAICPLYETRFLLADRVWHMCIQVSFPWSSFWCDKVLGVLYKNKMAERFKSAL